MSASAQHVCSAHREDDKAVWRDVAANACCCSRLCTTLIGPMLMLAASSSEAQWCVRYSVVAIYNKIFFFRARCGYIDTVVTAIGRGRESMLCCARFTAALAR